MNKIIMLLFLFFIFGNIQSQNMPEFVQNKLDLETARIREYLNNYRMSNNLYYPGHLLSGLFSDRERQIIDSLGLKLHVSMVYDDDMRERMVELLENKYRQYELDTLVNKEMSYNFVIYGIEALSMCHFDTISVFIEKLDSLVRLEPINRETKKYAVLRLLNLDTTTLYKNVFWEIMKDDKKKIENDIQNHLYYNNTYIAQLCGYVGDKRFIKPLEKALKLPKNFSTKVVLEALVRMKVEPYYTNYFNERVRSLEQVKNERPRKLIEDFAWVLGDQKSYLELSKYLLSNMPHQSASVIDYPSGPVYKTTPIYSHALGIIKDDILNPSLQKIIKAPTFDEKKESDRMKVYKWMQKNYGKYEIRRLW